MTQARSFHEILEEKLHGKPVEHPRAEASAPSVESLADVLEGLGNPVWTFASAPGARRAYPLKKASRPRTRPARGPVHALSDRQKNAADFFLNFGENLAVDFTQDELKGAYRRLALRLHPDVTKSGSGPFIELRGHARALEELFAA